MFFTFILGGLAGFATPYLEPHIRRAVEQLVPKDFPVHAAEIDLVTLILLLLVVVVLTGGSSPFALLLGALVGVFGKRIVALVQGEGRSE